MVPSTDAGAVAVDLDTRIGVVGPRPPPKDASDPAERVGIRVFVAAEDSTDVPAHRVRSMPDAV